MKNVPDTDDFIIAHSEHVGKILLDILELGKGIKTGNLFGFLDRFCSMYYFFYDGRQGTVGYRKYWPTYRFLGLCLGFMIIRVHGGEWIKERNKLKIRIPKMGVDFDIFRFLTDTQKFTIYHELFLFISHGKEIETEWLQDEVHYYEHHLQEYCTPIK